jgi:hypothetical protein
VPRGSDSQISFVDELQGRYTQNLSQHVGDFVIRRSDDVFSYQLVVTVDDLDQEITHVIRGADLLSSTPRQMYLARELGQTPPSYLHVPLVLDANGETPGICAHSCAPRKRNRAGRDLGNAREGARSRRNERAAHARRRRVDRAAAALRNNLVDAASPLAVIVEGP